MSRKVADCRRFPSVSGCSLTIAGEEKELLDEVEAHAVRVHEHTAGPELRKMLSEGLEDETAYFARILGSPGKTVSEPQISAY